jgi:hypothetical protein
MKTWPEVEHTVYTPADLMHQRGWRAGWRLMVSTIYQNDSYYDVDCNPAPTAGEAAIYGCPLGNAQLAFLTGYNEKSVGRILRQLVSRGIIVATGVTKRGYKIWRVTGLRRYQVDEHWRVTAVLGPRAQVSRLSNPQR